MDNQGPYVVGAQYLTSAPSIRQAPDHNLPEIAVTGRSNVGKSSLINALCNQKKLAKTSKTPGKTRLINFFEVQVHCPNFSFCLVDLPGYGYAKVSKEEQRRWGAGLEPFLRERRNLMAIGQLIDARHPPTQLDIQMREWLAYSGHRVITILTKIDKISRSAQRETRRQVTQILLSAGDPAPILFSAVKRVGVTELLALMAQLFSEQETSLEGPVVEMEEG
ncbi:MAG: ribosome biogenesis GTP-binding protein YihA/YsxC [bacterium]